MRAAIWRSPSAARGQPRRSRRRARPFAKITMRAVGATGWTVSSIGPVHRYGGALEIGSKTSIRKTRFFYAQSLRSEISPNQWIPTERSPPWRSGNNHGFCVTGGPPPIASEPTPSPRLWATPPGATPAGLCEHTMGADCQPSKPELSTWPGIGTFYLAPTLCGVGVPACPFLGEGFTSKRQAQEAYPTAPESLPYSTSWSPASERWPHCRSHRTAPSVPLDTDRHIQATRARTQPWSLYRRWSPSQVPWSRPESSPARLRPS